MVTQHVSPQFHVVYDELFQTVANPGFDDADPLWIRLFRSNRELYLDMEELEADLYPAQLREDYWTEEEAEFHRRDKSSAEATEELFTDVDVVPSQEPAPEGGQPTEAPTEAPTQGLANVQAPIAVDSVSDKEVDEEPEQEDESAEAPFSSMVQRSTGSDEETFLAVTIRVSQQGVLAAFGDRVAQPSG
ncbi:hypothetical protein MPSEU_000204300 [Mayamaea pseudoterrestris]|nr:hypothetical protein MPSEU_000204300 [Mayamaea pseudoterrestris]